MDARPGRQIPVVEHRRRGAVLSVAVHNRRRRGRNGAGATFVFIARRFSNWGWLRIDRLEPPSVAGPQAACGATTSPAAPLSRSRERGVLRHSMAEAHSLAGEGHNPEVGNIAHIDHRLTPALRQGSSLLHEARERNEPFWTGLWRNGTPDIWRRRANHNRRCRPMHQRGTKGMPALRVNPAQSIFVNQRCDRV
jgi:hypothetical protein